MNGTNNDNKLLSTQTSWRADSNIFLGAENNKNESQDQERERSDSDQGGRRQLVLQPAMATRKGRDSPLYRWRMPCQGQAHAVLRVSAAARVSGGNNWRGLCGRNHRRGSDAPKIRVLPHVPDQRSGRNHGRGQAFFTSPAEFQR